MTADRGEAALARLLQLVGEYQAGRLTEETLRARIAAEVELPELVRREAGSAVERGGRVIDFGSGNQLGTVNIRDAAGRDIINLTINVQTEAGRIGQATPLALTEDERAHKRALIAQHRKMLNTLELQAAKFGIYAPAHLTIEIDELKRTMAELKRELGEG
jgi:hypothetical protein